MFSHRALSKLSSNFLSSLAMAVNKLVTSPENKALIAVMKRAEESRFYQNHTNLSAVAVFVATLSQCISEKNEVETMKLKKK